jgi:hypothetical protein
MFVRKRLLKEKLEKVIPSTRDWIRVELKRLSKIRKSDSSALKVIDLGAGPGNVWKEVDAGNWLAKNNISLEVTLFDASDISSQPTGTSIKFSRSAGILPEDLSKHSVNSFDLVIALDLIEHLSKDHGYRLLYEIHRLSVVSLIRTPNGFVWQPPATNNPWQAHVSGWTPKEFKNLGWKIQYGESGLKWLLGVGAHPKWQISTNPLRRATSLIERLIIITSQVFLTRFPRVMFETVAVRREKEFDLFG